ncbi:MAG TPA: methyltransferase domain-containing protein [Nitrososphaeraceae archaeon]|nr:methyltransferase domain-containing protein [Nitrososphaeraceae archaeon]
MNDNDSSGYRVTYGTPVHRIGQRLRMRGSRSLFQVILDAASVGKDTKLLDIGCGSGLASAMAARLGAKVRGLDSSPNLLKIAKERIPDEYTNRSHKS